MPDNDIYLSWREFECGLANMIDERTAVELMKDLGEVRLHSRPQPGCENENIQIRSHDLLLNGI
jgi:hypothetical protein